MVATGFFHSIFPSLVLRFLIIRKPFTMTAREWKCKKPGGNFNKKACPRGGNRLAKNA